MLFTDGTFKTVPQQSAQMFTMHGKYRNFVFPIVFALSVRLDEIIYSRIYEVLRRKVVDFGQQLAPKGL